MVGAVYFDCAVFVVCAFSKQQASITQLLAGVSSLCSPCLRFGMFRWSVLVCASCHTSTTLLRVDTVLARAFKPTIREGSGWQ